MAELMGALWEGKDMQQASRDVIVSMRKQLQMIEKKEEYVQKKIEENLAKAKANLVTHKAVSVAALKRKKGLEKELEKLQGVKVQLEMNMNTLESTGVNQETMVAMKKTVDTLKHVYGDLTFDEADKVMSGIQEQRQFAVESLDLAPFGFDIDEGAEPAPIHLPPGATKTTEVKNTAEMDEEAMLKQLQAELAM